MRLNHPFTKEVLEKIFRGLLEEEGLKMGKLAQPLRVALTGGTVSPGIYEVMELLGKTRTLDRIRKGIKEAEGLFINLQAAGFIRYPPTTVCCFCLTQPEILF